MALGTIVHPTVPSVVRHFGHPNVILIPLRGIPPMRSALVWRNTADPRVEAFVEIVQEVLPSPTSRAGPAALRR